ncbi:MAG TPA: hydrogenase 4 subunit B [Candidatus Paceibacterota bacterium]|nr:hydrogenase 4 subunit B [Verrucomicrobiota bacterium]HRZ46533.1 hydrogenase 4 subunit B [Candidatus Paceibacterota bacterium]
MSEFPSTLLLLALCAYAAGMAGALVFRRAERLANGIGFGLASAGGTLGLASFVSALASGSCATAGSIQLVPSLIPFVRFSIRADPLGCFFGMTISLLAVAIGIYSIGYARGYYGRKSVGALAALFNLLLLSTTLVFLADHAWFFLMAWEIMALSAYCLVSFDHEHEESRGAGVLFFVMSHAGTAGLILGFLILHQASGTWGFDGFASLGGRLPASLRNVCFLLFLFGFGVKAGMVPLHIWLPAAHPVAPSNVSALMSGVLIKTGIYGLVRVSFDWLGAPPSWWGGAVLAIGTISALLGVLFALMEHDLKRLLAYHSIENIGIILMGLGASMMFLHWGRPALAALALIAGLYHTINHASFKALLFLGAGAVLHATHTRNMEEMGGLARRMRWTALFFLVGAVAISALPPLNGFVSEWLTYQSLLQGFGASSSLLRLMLPLSGAMLALTGALAAACFVKAFGITFLAQPRSAHARSALEAPAPMLAGQAILTAACVFLGLFPMLLLRLFDPLTLQLTGQQLSQQLVAARGMAIAAIAPQGGAVSTLGIALMLVCLLPAPLAAWLLFGRRTRMRVGPTWDCGLRGLTPHMQYTATGFSKPLRMIFKALFRPRREVQREYDFSPYFATTIRFESHVEEPFQTRIYRPLKWLVLRASRRLRALQAGSIQAYLIYIFVTLVALLLVAL